MVVPLHYKWNCHSQFSFNAYSLVFVKIEENFWWIPQFSEPKGVYIVRVGVPIPIAIHKNETRLIKYLSPYSFYAAKASIKSKI